MLSGIRVRGSLRSDCPGAVRARRRGLLFPGGGRDRHQHFSSRRNGVQGARAIGQGRTSPRLVVAQTLERGQLGSRCHPEWGLRGARGRERAGPTRSHPEPGRDPAQRRRVLWGRLHGRRGRRGHPAAPMKGSGEKTEAARLSRGGAAVARWAHNPKVGGSNPSPATRKAGTNWYRPFSVYAIMRARKESDRQLGTCDFGLRGRSGIPETLRWLRPSWWLALS
jgi:hypothetical protein